MKKLLLLITIFLTFSVSAQFTSGKCIRVVDGDTYIFVTSKDTLKIRDAYMNTPETKNSACTKAQPYSNEATEKAKEYLLGKEFKIQIMGTDIYGRTLAYAKLPDGTYFHKVMIANGFAWSYKQSGINYRLQKKAQKDKLGLWKDEDSVDPSVWLKVHTTQKQHPRK